MQPGALSARQSGLLRQQRVTVAMESDSGQFRASLSSGQAVLRGAKRRGAGNIVAGSRRFRRTRVSAQAFDRMPLATIVLLTALTAYTAA